jgi:adenosylmethionine-8-amino-7-oxononanoate aminotransferase
LGGQLPGIVFEKADGIMLVDTEGKEYIDIASQLTCCNLGHRQGAIIEAISNALSKTDYTEAYFGYSNPYSSQCAQKLAEITLGNLKHFFFTSGGAEANEFAIRFARLYWHAKGRPDKFKIISLYNSYHGSAGLSGSATGISRVYSSGQGPQAVGFVKMPPAYCYRCPFGLSYPRCGVQCAQYLSYVIDNEDPDTVAAFIGEPIQGGGGVIDPPPEYWPMVRKICSDCGVLLIADEVQSGFCRTGRMWALEHWDIVPDIMSMSKGIAGSVLPFGAVAIGHDLYEAMKGQTVPGGYTYSGHPISCAASVAAIDIYVKDKIAENAARVGKHIKERLDAEFSPLPKVGNIRGKGLFLAVELVSDRKTKTPISPDVRKELTLRLHEAGIVPRGGGYMNSVLYITPPCTITTEEADRALDIIKPIVIALGTR